MTNNTLKDYFEKLKLNSFMSTYLENIDKKLSNYELLELLCKQEIVEKDKIAKDQMIKTAGFPSVKTLEEFDFDFQPSINKEKIMYLSKLDFIKNKESIILTGSSGVGKTHIAIGLGVKSASERISTYFIKAQKLLTNLKLAYDENRLEARLKHYNRYKVLIIDELGFLPLSNIEAKLLFQLMELRYETKSTIITSNLTVDKWSDIFDDVVIASAITDRLLHHATLFNINGGSYRLKHLTQANVED